MPAVSRLVAIGLGAAAILVSAAWRAQTPQVQHALVPVGQVAVELWRDPGDGELALQYQGSDDWTILRRRTRYDLIEGRLSNVTVYLTTARAWKPIHSQYGFTPEQVDAALDSSQRVDRPRLMDIPSLDRPTRAYFFVRDFGTDVGRLRKAARFPVPAPGQTLAGLQLANVSLSQFRGPGRLVDGGYVASLFYSANPDHLGRGERQLALEAAWPRTNAGDSYRRSFFAASSLRLVGPGYDARLTSTGDAILRYQGIYVLVSLRLDLSVSRLRAVLSQIGRS
jgi:hypothetical protein